MTKPKLKLCQPEQSPTPQDAADLLRVLIRAFTRQHKQLRIVSQEIGSKLIVAISCHPDDVPKIVGQGGRHIWSIHTIARRMSARISRQIEVRLNDPGSRARLPQPEFRANPNWDKDKVAALFTGVLSMMLRHPFHYRFVPVDQVATGIEFSVHELELPFVRGDLTQALETIFRAIGRNEGQDLVVGIIDPAPAPPPPAIDQLETVERGAAADDEIAREARERGFI